MRSRRSRVTYKSLVESSDDEKDEDFQAEVADNSESGDEDSNAKKIPKPSGKKKKDQRPTSAFRKQKPSRVIESDEEKDSYKPDSDSAEESGSEEGQEEEEKKVETPVERRGSTTAQRIESSDEEERVTEEKETKEKSESESGEEEDNHLMVVTDEQLAEAEEDSKEKEDSPIPPSALVAEPTPVIRPLAQMANATPPPSSLIAPRPQQLAQGFSFQPRPVAPNYFQPQRMPVFARYEFPPGGVVPPQTSYSPLQPMRPMFPPAALQPPPYGLPLPGVQIPAPLVQVQQNFGPVGGVHPATVGNSTGASESLSDVLSHAMQDEF